MSIQEKIVSMARSFLNMEGDTMIARDITRHPMKDRELIREIALHGDLSLLGIGVDHIIPDPYKAIQALTNQHDSDIYRIHIRDIGKDRISVICVGMERVDACLEGAYDNLQELPQWVQERIAVLSMLDAKPPTQNIEGVGRRINENTYWVYRPSSC